MVIVVVCMDKKIIMKDNNLNELDSLTQTYGCRHSNPDICNNNGIIGKCAFVKLLKRFYQL